MNLRIVLFFLFFGNGVLAQLPVTFQKLENNKKVLVKIGNKIFTNYYNPGVNELKKAVLFPVYSPRGKMVTRGWPIEPKAGERIDHPHHVGVWLNYEDVNGHDFWNNSLVVDRQKHKYGTIVADENIKFKPGKKSGEMQVSAKWLDINGESMLGETTKYVFSGNKERYIVDRITTLTATNEKVIFKDVKDGFFAIRVHRGLEMPSDKADVFTDAAGNATTVSKLNNEGVNGNYINAEGIEGEKTWGMRSAWVTLQGIIENENTSLTIIDHPKNTNYPAYWHTRGYGLFSVNPLGENVFSKGQKQLNLSLEPGQSVTFRYRLVVASSHLDKSAINILASEFGYLY